MKKIRAFVFSHGHMDIEWYQPLRSYRFWLIEAIERQIRQCREDPETASYTLDGQMFPVEEYLDVCPGREETIRTLVRDKKLWIGPFYTQFDEWIPSGESMIRNCLHGDRMAKKFGEPMKVGYLPDNFGHPLQLPQIFNGFGIDSLLFMRGMPFISENFPDEFVYEGLDGSKLTAINFRDSYSHMFSGSQIEYCHDRRDTPYYHGYMSYEMFLNMAKIDDLEDYANKMIEYVEKMEDTFPSGIVPVVIGCDHAPPHVGLTQAIRRANEIQDRIEFVTGSPEEYIQMLRSYQSDMPVVREELVGTRFQYILFGALSTRSHIKRDNFASEVLLEKYAEPLEAIASVYGKERVDSPAQLEEAWRWLMINHAHDSIHGSSADEVHEEMRARYNMIRQISTGVAHNAMSDLGALTKRWWNPGTVAALVYQPVLSGRPQYAETWMKVTSETGSMEDACGRKYPLQILAREEPEKNDIGLPTNIPNPPVGYERVLFRLPQEQGFSTLAFHGSSAENPEGMNTGENYIENEYLRVTAEDAVLDIWDKAENRHYYGQNLLCESAEAGDYWDTSPTWIPSEVVLSNRFDSSVEITEKGPVRAVMKVDFVMDVPRKLSGGRRSKERVKMPVQYTVSLYSGRKAVQIGLKIDNTAEDHKMTLRIEPQLKSKDIISQNAFGVLRRPVDAPKPAGECIQPATEIHPFREWLAMEDDRHGFAVACRGIYNYESFTDRITGNTAVELTLFRGVGNMNRDNIKMRKMAAAGNYEFKGGQCLGQQEIEYAFIPYSVGQKREALEEINAYLYPPLCHIVKSEAEKTTVDELKMPFRWNESNIVFSAFKHAADDSGYILRLYENEGRDTRAKIELNGFSEAFLCDLNETVEEQLPIQDGKLELAFRPFKIVTVYLRKGDQ